MKKIVKMVVAFVVITFVTTGALAIDTNPVYANYNEECLNEGCDREEVRELHDSYANECFNEQCFYEEVRELAGGAAVPPDLVFDTGQLHYRMFDAFRRLFRSSGIPCYAGYTTPAWTEAYGGAWNSDECWQG